MSPILRERDVLYVLPCDRESLSPGDIVSYHSGDAGQVTTHRVTAVGSDHITTKGDNNPGPDRDRVHSEDVIGRVIAIRRGNRYMTVRGGSAGRRTAVAVAAVRLLRLGIRFVLKPAEALILRSTSLKRLVLGVARPRVLSFQRREGVEFQLIVGKRVAARLPPGSKAWQARSPFGMLVDLIPLPESGSGGTDSPCDSSDNAGNHHEGSDNPI